MQLAGVGGPSVDETTASMDDLDALQILAHPVVVFKVRSICSLISGQTQPTPFLSHMCVIRIMH